MDADRKSGGSPLDAFLHAWAKDRAAGRVRSAAGYCSEFPAVAGETIRLVLGAGSPDGEGADDASRADGEWIGPYLLMRELGRGGQGVVYLAEDSRLHRRVAVKVLTAGSLGGPESLIRFQREAEVASRLNHPGICPVYDTGTSHAGPYLVMPYIGGATLAEKIKQRDAASTGSLFIDFATGKLDPETWKDDDGPGDSGSRSPATGRELLSVVHLIEQAAEALHAAHEAGIVHRDIKPGNIMIDSSGRPVIMDFGLARDDTPEAEHLTRTGDMFGTPPYMAPEQIAGSQGVCDRRTDVWSLGVTLYECVTGKRPFDAPTRMGLFKAISTVEPPDPRRVNRAVSKDLSAVIRCALSKPRGGRYRTALAFAEDLGRVRRKQPILAKSPGPLVRLSRWFERNPALASSVTAAFLFLAAGILVALKLAADERRTARLVVAERTAYERLADLGRLEDLKNEHHRLWPATPAVAPAMAAWIRSAEDLLSRLDGHRMSIDLLRRSAQNTEDPQAARGDEQVQSTLDHLHAEQARLEGWRAVYASGQPEGDADWDHKRAEVEARLDGLAFVIKKIEEEHPPKARYRFASPEDQWRHDRLDELVQLLDRFAAEDPHGMTLHSMRKRLMEAETVEEATLRAHAEAWRKCLAEVAEDTTIYKGFRLEPQLGLIPIGRNPQGYQEFLHWASSDGLRTHGDDGRLLPEAGVVLVLLPGGTFTMGSPPGEPGRDQDERAHLVTLEPFFTGKYEVTQAQWLRAMGSNPSNDFPGKVYTGRVRQDNTLLHPVETVTWHEAAGFAKRLGLALPTEAQWEYAARGLTDTPWCVGADQAALQGRANLFDERGAAAVGAVDAYLPVPWSDGYAYHAPVDAFPANPFGLHGIHGNVSEWCRDYRRFNYPPNSLVPGDGGELTGAGGEPTRVFRDGSWQHPPSMSRSASRYALQPASKAKFLGLRVARSLDR